MISPIILNHPSVRQEPAGSCTSILHLGPKPDHKFHLPSLTTENHVSLVVVPTIGLEPKRQDVHAWNLLDLYVKEKQPRAEIRKSR